MGEPTTQDASLYNMARDLLNGTSTTTEDERRVCTRHEFESVQLLAPFDGQRMPLAGEFIHVFCRDISGGGFSFFMNEPPTFEQTIMAIGNAPFRFFVAKVMRVVEDGEHGATRFIVGCKFERRIEPNGKPDGKSDSDSPSDN